MGLSLQRGKPTKAAKGIITSALFKYFDEFSEDVGRDIQLDVIALCCEWSEYGSIQEACDQYSDDIQTLDDLNDHTVLLFLDNGGFMVRDF